MPNAFITLADSCWILSFMVIRKYGFTMSIICFRAVEELVLEMGGCDVWLHVRLDQPAPCALYSGDGYEEVAREKSLGAFASIFGGGKPSSPRALMRKSLRDDGSCNFML